MNTPAPAPLTCPTHLHLNQPAMADTCTVADIFRFTSHLLAQHAANTYAYRMVNIHQWKSTNPEFAVECEQGLTNMISRAFRVFQEANKETDQPVVFNTDMVRSVLFTALLNISSHAEAFADDNAPDQLQALIHDTLLGDFAYCLVPTGKLDVMTMQRHRIEYETWIEEQAMAEHGFNTANSYSSDT